MSVPSDENPAVVLIVDRQSRRIVDCERLTYYYTMHSVFERHDLSKVDIIVRAAETTEPTKVASEELPPVEAPPSTPDSDDDIPF